MSDPWLKHCSCATISVVQQNSLSGQYFFHGISIGSSNISNSKVELVQVLDTEEQSR